MRYLNEGNIRTILFTSSISLVAILSMAFFTFYVLERQNDLKHDIPKIEEDFINHQKEMLSFVVNLQIDQIDFQRRQIKKRIQLHLTEHVDEAKMFAQSLLDSHKSSGETHQIIGQALSSLRFIRGEGYFFSMGLDGRVRFYPPNKSFNGQPISACFNLEQQQIIAQMIALVKKKQSGFLEYAWPLPGVQNKLQNKISYISYFEPLNGFIGTGAYFDAFAELTRTNIAENLKQFAIKSPKNYFFVYELHNIQGGDGFATMLLNPNRPDLIGCKLTDNYKDAHGKMFRKEFLNGLRKNGESFVTYWYKKPGAEKPKQKLSYFKLYPEWNWVVAKGVYLDDLEKVITNKKTALEASVKNKSITFSLFFIIAVILVVLIAHYFTQGINSIFVEYKQMQEKHQNELESINIQLHKQATTDSLTQLYNRCHFNEQLKQSMATANRYNQSLALFLFDIDHFKDVNDTFGHLSGDAVLKELSNLIRLKIRGSDILARWGGEEFVLLMHEVDKRRAAILATRLCDAVADFNFSINRQVTCSFGVTMYQPGESDIHFINRADDALYRAKEEGRNRVIVA